MTLVRYNPNRGYLSMQDTMNSLVNALFNSDASGLVSEANELSPRMDMKETEDAYTVKLTMPGIDKDDIDISVSDGVLTISGVAYGTDIVVYTVSGTEVVRQAATEPTTTINTGLQSGTIAIVKVGNKSVKIKL